MEWEHAPAGNAERKAGFIVVGQTVQTVDGTRDPGDQDCERKNKACTKVRHLDRVESSELERSA